jgi:hypothetical protein
LKPAVLSRAVLIRTALAVASLALAVFPAGAQEVRVVGITPEKPAPGSSFVVTVEVSEASAEMVEPVEPELAGPASYNGADVRPGGGDPSSALVAYRFTATGPGRVDVRSLSVRVRRRTVNLGSWVVEIEQGSAAPVRRYGSWSAPGSVWARQSFVVAALDPVGGAALCPPFAVEGAIVEPLPGMPGTYSVTVLESGSWRLPTLELEEAAGKYTLRGREVTVRALPPAASAARSIGGPWRLELVEPRPARGGSPGDTIAWEIRAIGGQNQGFSEAPSIAVMGPSGEPVRLDPGMRFYSETRSMQSVVGARGIFTAVEPGEYTVRPEPYAWFDTDSGTIRKALAPAVRFTVATPVPSIVEPPAAIIKYAGRMLESDALESGDWRAVRTAVHGSLGIPDGRGALAKAKLAPKDALLAACVGFAAGDRAEAYGIFLRLEKSAFPPSGIRELADSAAGSFGNLDRVSYVLPPFGLTGVAGTSMLVLAAIVFLAKRRFPVFIVPVAVLLLGVSAASMAERAAEGFVSLGAVARKVPSVHAKGTYMLEPGITGRVLETAGDWLFVEPADAEAAWISIGDVVRY